MIHHCWRLILALLVCGPAGANDWVIDGIVSPGNSPGCIVDHGNVTFNAGASLRIELAGTVPCSEYDRFSVQQTLTLNGATLEVVLLDGYQPQAGDRFVVVEWGTLVGNFSAIVLSGATLIDPTLSWDTSQITVNGELIIAGPPTTQSVPIPHWAVWILTLLVLSGALAACKGKIYWFTKRRTSTTP